ncbi:unnamed protein product [Rotaria sp. Silwood1]|nr:unnamed protein product [Rotaria sp. Silwood1]CAF3661464.1 unnamed protein product [Rotaria sp. Silwood1]CAF4552169.1 unnamed protein product [Rotaria sp. Silwood1]CAF4577775.1 unnamed protein product [Rotaria sp. Silwood1]CAF4780460.1 unnamed protein product [Rotaria sp. Silwood1]
MVRAYHYFGDFDQALAFSNEALRLYQRLDEHENVLGIAQVLINMGLVHSDKGYDNTSFNNFERAHRLLKKIYSFDHPEISYCLAHLLFAHYHNGDYEQALDCLLKSLQMGEPLLPTNHPHIAVVENNIGKQYYKQGKYEKALQRFHRAVDINNTTLTHCTRNYIVLLNNIGKVFYRLKNFDEATVYYEKALHLIEKIYSLSHDHIYLAYTLKNRGEVLFALGDFTGALELFEQAHNMYGRSFGQDTNHRDIAKCKHLIGLTHFAIGDQDKATEALDNALRMWINVLPQYHPDLALSHRSMADLYTKKKGEAVKAILHYQTAISIYEKRLPIDHELLMDLKNRLMNLENEQSTTM